MDLTKLGPGHQVEMYTSPTCPYCVQARKHFDAAGIAYTLYDAQNDRALRQKMFAYSNDDPTVPVIVVDGAYVQSGWGSPPRG
jgi:glutaredoxin 3